MHVQCQATRCSAVERQGRSIECTKVTQYASYTVGTFLKHTTITHEKVRKYRYHKNCTVTSSSQIITLLHKHSSSQQSHSYTQALHLAMMLICLPAVGPRQIDNYRNGHTRRKKGERNRLIRHRTAVILL